MKKKKVGRPKKRGPKKKRRYVSKKPKIDGRTLVSHKVYYDYKIISCHNFHKNGDIGKYKTIKEAYEALNTLKEQNKQIVFKRNVHLHDKIEDSFDEYLLLEENRDGNKENLKLRNKIGKFSEVKTNIDDWIIIDKAEKCVEETFYVFGYDNKSDRKTFPWIYETFIKNFPLKKENFKRIMQYKNKIVFKNENNTFDIVFCKNVSDAIKFYNLLTDFVKKDNVKNIYFRGSYDEIGEKRTELENRLIEYTGFTRKKIQMAGTTYR